MVVCGYVDGGRSVVVGWVGGAVSGDHQPSIGQGRIGTG